MSLPATQPHSSTTVIGRGGSDRKLTASAMQAGEASLPRQEHWIQASSSARQAWRLAAGSWEVAWQSAVVAAGQRAFPQLASSTGRLPRTSRCHFISSPTCPGMPSWYRQPSRFPYAHGVTRCTLPIGPPNHEEGFLLVRLVRVSPGALAFEPICFVQPRSFVNAGHGRRPAQAAKPLATYK